MAEWICEKVLKIPTDGYPDEPREFRYLAGSTITVEEHVFCPDGFFAVLGKLRKHLPNQEIACAWLQFLLDGEFDAFYSAVYEAMNNKEVEP